MMMPFLMRAGKGLLALPPTTCKPHGFFRAGRHNHVHTWI